MNAHFSPVTPFDPEEMSIAAGVTDFNEVCALLTCDADANDGIMLGTSIYGAFARDLSMRTG